MYHIYLSWLTNLDLIKYCDDDIDGDMDDEKWQHQKVSS